jgi:hypothetical protein
MRQYYARTLHVSLYYTSNLAASPRTVMSRLVVV